MKILQIAQRFNPSISGSQYHVYRISKELIKLGHDVTVITTTSMHNKDIRGFSTSRPFTMKSTDPILPKFEYIDGIKVYRFGPIFQFWMHMVNPLMFKFLSNKIHKYDIVHGHVYMGAESDMAAMICASKNIPFVFTGHDLISNQNGIIKFIKEIYDKTEGRFTLKNAKILIALTSENDVQYKYLGVPENKIRIVPNGVDYKKFDVLKRSNELLKVIENPDKIVLFVGRLVMYKGVQYIIRAIPKIIDEYHNTKFIFVGEDQGYKKYLVKLAKDLGVIDKCIFTGKIDENDLLKYYSIADVFVLPSIGEGFGLVALEAIASNIPTILAKEGGLKYILSKIGGHPLDMTQNIPGQIIDTIKKIFSETNIQKIKKEKDILKRYYTWEGVAKELEDIYIEVVQ